MNIRINGDFRGRMEETRAQLIDALAVPSPYGEATAANPGLGIECYRPDLDSEIAWARP